MEAFITVNTDKWFDSFMFVYMDFHIKCLCCRIGTVRTVNSFSRSSHKFDRIGLRGRRSFTYKIIKKLIFKKRKSQFVALLYYLKNITKMLFLSGSKHFYVFMSQIGAENFFVISALLSLAPLESNLSMFFQIASDVSICFNFHA